ncbi:hypothetical protein [Martelella endophytica]|uniref:hypothetical protein n=1 Tax=Martelella endophytica TaxID=1486262 RepID=UPI0005F266B2|nr:hypothetical protein [Martelella endophytica]
MKYLLAATFLAISVGSAGADDINRYDIQDMTCNQVHTILDQQGAAILRYPAPNGSGRTLYDRYVRDPLVCVGEGNHAIQRTVPVRDTPNCPTFSCKPGPRECDRDGGLFCISDN